MRRDEALAILTTHQSELKEFGVKSLALFGSVARDEAKPESDVDLLVEFQSGKSIGLFELVKLQQHLETLLGCAVDLVTPDSLKPRLRDRILNETVPALPLKDWNFCHHETEYNMPRKDPKVYIDDILESITDIESFIDGFNFESFSNDKMRVNAVLRSLTIIGEAARKIPPEVETRYPQIPWVQMRGMRNVVVHDYRRVNLNTVWNTIQNYLPGLVTQLRQILEDRDSDL
jgi:uncharacterized protein with HEPN domain/predicted nucleotidyltransferase